MLNRRRVLPHSGKLLFLNFIFSPRTGFVCWFVYSSFLPVKIMSICFLKKKLKTKNRRKQSYGMYVCMYVKLSRTTVICAVVTAV